MGGSAPTDMRVRPGRGPRELRAKSASLLEPYGLWTREAQALSVGFESQTRIRIARAVRNAAIVQTSHLQRILRVGYALSALSDTPKRTPKNLWLLLEVLGSPWRIGGCESSLETEPSGVCWMSMDVPGSPWTSLDGSPGRIRSRA